MSSSAPRSLETIPRLIFLLDWTGQFVDDSFCFLLSKAPKQPCPQPRSDPILLKLLGLQYSPTSRRSSAG